jgi:D-glycero-D-manno-heptose 1,7-bisphosphate phosphatase
MTDLRPALFLDRDGVINEETGYLHRPQDLVLIEGAARTIARANMLGVPVVVVTNQAGIGRGLYTEADYHAVQAHLERLLRTFGARLDASRFCPHHPEQGVGAYRRDCDCRKPRPGLLLAAARDLGLDLARSVLVGDKAADLAAGRAAGCATVLVRTGYGRQAEHELVRGHGEALWDAVFDSLGAAEEFLVRHFQGK